MSLKKLVKEITRPIVEDMGGIVAGDGTINGSPSKKKVKKNKTNKMSGYKKVNENDKAELYKLYSRAMKAMPGSPNQKKLKKQIAVLRKKLGMNEDLTPLRKIYMDLDKRFKNYDSNKTKDFNKVLKFLKSKLRPGSQIPAFIASFYNDYKGGEDIDKNQKRYFKYTKKMLKKESVNEAIEPSGIMAKINKIVQDKQAAKIDGVLMDMFSASIMMRIFNAVNDKAKKDMNKGTMRQVKVILHKVMKQNKVKA